MSNLFFEINHNKNSKIKFIKSDIKFNFDIMQEFDNYTYLYKKRNIEDSYFKNKIESVVYLDINNRNYLFHIFDINLDNPKSGFIRAEYKDNKFIFNIEELKNKKYETLIQNMISDQMYNYIKHMKYCERENFLYNYTIQCIIYFFDFLEIGGNVYINFLNYCENVSFEIIYLLSCLFEKIIIYDGFTVYCNSFLYNNSTISKEDIHKCIDNRDFTITNKINFDSFASYINDQVKNLINNYKLLSSKKYEEYINNKINTIYDTLTFINISKETLIYFYKKILNNFKKVILDKKLISTNSSIKDIEGNFLSKIINDNKFKNGLEIGMAFGVSSLYILSSNENIKLLSVDPFQKTQWYYYGIKLLKNFDLDNRHKLMLEKNFSALPKILGKYGNNYFDFIFIDGWHTFDYTLIDFFYSDLLLKKDGIIIIDDALHKGVSKCIKYINTNYKHYIKIESPITVAAYKKLYDDKREWNFHIDF